MVVWGWGEEGLCGGGEGEEGLSYRAGMLELLGVGLSRSAVMKTLSRGRGVGVMVSVGLTSRLWWEEWLRLVEVGVDCSVEV